MSDDAFVMKLTVARRWSQVPIWRLVVGTVVLGLGVLVLCAGLIHLVTGTFGEQGLRMLLADPEVSAVEVERLDRLIEGAVARRGVGIAWVFGEALMVVFGVLILVLAKVKPVLVEIRPTGVRLNGEWIAACDILVCDLRGNTVLLQTTAGPRYIDTVDLNDAYRLAEVVQKLVFTAAQRVEEESARTRVQRQQAALAAQLRSAGPGGPGE